MKTALVLILLSSLTGFSWAVTFDPQIAPPTPPDLPENVPFLFPPTSPTTQEYPVLPAEHKLFGLGYKGELAGLCQLNSASGQSLINLWGAVLNVRFADPWSLGRQLGLAEDALEFRLGSGLVVANNSTSGQQLTLPLLAAARLYLKESSLWGLNPFVGLGVNLNFEGFPTNFGRAGALVQAGVVHGRLEFSIGYNSYRASSDNYAEGFLFTVGQPFGL